MYLSQLVVLVDILPLVELVGVKMSTSSTSERQMSGSCTSKVFSVLLVVQVKIKVSTSSGVQCAH